MKIINNKIFKILVIVFIFSIIIGIISYFLLDKSIDNIIYDYLNMINEGNYSRIKSIINTCFQNNRYLFYIWISGILLLSFIIVPLMVMGSGISLGILFTSLLINFKFKGLLFFIIILIPYIFNILIYILCGYYSLHFSIKIYNTIKKDKLINIKYFSKNYVYIFMIFILLLIISSLFEIYISFNIIRLII